KVDARLLEAMPGQRTLLARHARKHRHTRYCEPHRSLRKRDRANGGENAGDTHHSPLTTASAAREERADSTSAGTARSAPAPRDGAADSRVRPGGSPVPTWAVSSASRIAPAVLRTRSPVACTTSPGSLSFTVPAHPETYGIVYAVVSMPCAAPII